LLLSPLLSVCLRDPVLSSLPSVVSQLCCSLLLECATRGGLWERAGLLLWGVCGWSSARSKGGTCKTRADFPAPSQAAWGPLALLASVEVQAAEQESQTLLVQVVKVKNCDL